MTGSPRQFPLRLFAAALLAAASAAAAAQDVVNREYDLKAAYLYHFGHYVHWPELGETFVIGVLGADPFGGSLREIETSRKVAGKPVSVLRFRSMTDYRPCNILFISAHPHPSRPRETAAERLQAAVEKTRGTAVLLVGDTEGFATQGAAVNFNVDADANVIRMEINLETVKRAGLKIGAPLLGLKVVTLVRDEP